MELDRALEIVASSTEDFNDAIEYFESVAKEARHEAKSALEDARNASDPDDAQYSRDVAGEAAGTASDYELAAAVLTLVLRCRDTGGFKDAKRWGEEHLERFRISDRSPVGEHIVGTLAHMRALAGETVPSPPLPTLLDNDR